MLRSNSGIEMMIGVSAVVALSGRGKYGGVKLSRYRLPPPSSCHTMRPYVIHHEGVVNLVVGISVTLPDR